LKNAEIDNLLQPGNQAAHKAACVRGVQHGLNAHYPNLATELDSADITAHQMQTKSMNPVI
jgi:hypothetical protein